MGLLDDRACLRDLGLIPTVAWSGVERPLPGDAKSPAGARTERKRSYSVLPSVPNANQSAERLRFGP